MPNGAYTPTFEVWSGGQNFTANFLNRTVSVEVEMAYGDGQSNTCTIVVDDRDWLVNTVYVENGLEIYLGYKEIGMAYLGAYKIDRVKYSFPPKIISVHGNSVDFRGSIKGAVTNQFTDKTVGDVLKDTLQKAGFNLEIDGKIGEIKLPFFQGTSSPLGILDQLARQYGGAVSVNGNTVKVSERDSGKSASGVTMNRVGLGPEHFAHVDVEHTARSLYDKVVAVYRDKDKNEDVEVSSNTKASGFITQGGSDGSGDRIFRIKGTHLTKESAQAAADAAMTRLADNLGQAQLELAQGDPWLSPGQRLNIMNTREGIDGAYTIDLIKHQFTKESGLKTWITTKPPGTNDTSFDVNAEGTIMPGVGQVTGEYLPVGSVRAAAPGTSTPPLN